jgi:hypothetical protein
MENDSARRITEIERAGSGVLISFDDGKSAVYSAALLYAALPQAQAMLEYEDEN